jgi:hypothetical protein
MKNAKYPIFGIIGIVILLFLGFWLGRASRSNQTGDHPLPKSEVSAVDHNAGEAYLRQNISLLSPESAVLGGTFYVTSVTWSDDGLALVEYEDGHIALKAEAVLEPVDEVPGGIKVKSFQIVE